MRATLCALVVTVLSLVAAPATAHADRIRDQQWHLGTLRADGAWSISTGERVVVAVLDSGVDASHPDLTGRVLPGADFVGVTEGGESRGDGRTDTVGHGTTVAALIAGEDDGSGVVGIAPGAKILPVRVLDRKNRYRDARTVAAGLRWAVDHGATVVNMSLGGSLQSPELADAIQYAYDNDVVVVACAGNVGGEDRAMWYPAREPGVIAVTGLTRDGTFWKGSLSGQGSVLSAPATSLVGARPGGYWKVQGTSFAAPMVSGTAALVRSRWSDMTAPNVINRLIRTARDLGPAGRDDRYGFGLVDPVAALKNPVSSVRNNPLDTTPPSPRPSGSWSVSPAPRTAAAGDGRHSPWLWAGVVGFALLVVVGSGVTVSVAVVRHRRGRQPVVWHPER